MNRLRDERGQVTVLAAVFMVAILGLAGVVIDVGSWFRQQREAQSTADAAALAGAQALPGDTATAHTLATDFASRNGGSSGVSITFGSKFTPQDMITVDSARPAAGFFSRLFGITTITTRAHASAVAEIPTAATYVAPIAVNILHPYLSGPGCPCFGVPTTIPLGKKGVPGAFGMIDLNQSHNGNTGTSTLADWILNGFDGYLAPGNYDSDPGAKFNSSQIQTALQERYGTDLLFPIYDQLTGNGSNAVYHIVGWASFHLTLSQANGSNGTLSGYFDRTIWDGIVSTSGPDSSIPDLGVYSVALVN